jgi:asparagine synthase (glutamine-hydrolysing)
MVRRYLARRRASNGHLTGSDRNLLDEILSLDEQAVRIYQIRTMFLPRFLKWDDRNSMSFSVEARYPFLDHELINLCLSFAPETLYQKGWTKVPLRIGLKNELPIKVRLRKTKFGFETPQDRWLCGPLRHYVEAWLTHNNRPLWNLVDRQKILRLAEETWKTNGKRDEPGQALFRALMFDRWLEIFGIEVPASSVSACEK